MLCFCVWGLWGLVVVAVCEIPLGAIVPEGQGCPPASWQSFGSHGNEAQAAPAPGLWCSPPPAELEEKKERTVEKKKICSASSKIDANKQLRAAAGTAKSEVGQMKAGRINH